MSGVGSPTCCRCKTDGWLAYLTLGYVTLSYATPVGAVIAHWTFDDGGGKTLLGTSVSLKRDYLSL